MNILVISDGFWPDHTGGISKSLLPEVGGLVARVTNYIVIWALLKERPSIGFIPCSVLDKCLNWLPGYISNFTLM